MNRLWVIVLLSLMTACTTPVGYTNAPLATYDKDTEYRTDDNPAGFTLTIYHSRYQYFPESDAIAQSCKSALTSLAYELAEKKGQKIQPINEQRIKLSFGRNGFSGMTSCSATVPVEWAVSQ